MGLSVETDQVFKDGMTDSVTYTAYGQSGVSISAILMLETRSVEHFDDGKWTIRRKEILCLSSSVSSPSSRDTVKIGSETWQVDDEVEIHEDDNGTVTLPLVLKTRGEVSGPDLRIRR